MGQPITGHTYPKDRAGKYELVGDRHEGKKLLHSQVMAHPQETIHELLLLGASDLRLVALFLLQLCDPPSVLPFPFLLLSLGKVGFDQRAPTDPNIGIRKGVSGPGFRQKALRFPCMFRIGKQQSTAHRGKTANQVTNCRAHVPSEGHVLGNGMDLAIDRLQGIKKSETQNGVAA